MSPTQDELKARLRRVLGKRLRQVFKFSGLRSFAKKRMPYCGSCGDTRDLEIDHEPPVIPVDRDVTEPLEYFKRMFCMDDDGCIRLERLNTLCVPCHAKRTKEQDIQRQENKTGRFSVKSREKAAATRARRKKSRLKKHNNKKRRLNNKTAKRRK
jgi:5-methylcytosine-specific restriction endonuclease McrA